MDLTTQQIAAPMFAVIAGLLYFILLIVEHRSGGETRTAVTKADGSVEESVTTVKKLDLELERGFAGILAVIGVVWVLYAYGALS